MNRRAFIHTTLATAAAFPSLAAATARDWGPVAHYPDPDIEALDKRFRFNVNTGGIERIATGNRWCEGPVYFRDLRCLIFSDIPNNRMMRWNEEDGAISVFRQPSNYANGNCRDRQGRLLTCEHDTRRVTRTEHDGSITVLLDRFDNKPLNAPNDIVVGSDGAVWFTDPGYGISGNYESSAERPFELPTNVYRIDGTSGKATVVAGDFVRPNGLAFSPDEKKLYIVDSAGAGLRGPSHIRVFDVSSGRLSNGRVFAEMGKGTSDGIRLDIHGNIWCTYGWGDRNEDGVRCYAPEGDLIGKIHLPETPANLTFGGPKRNRLFMCASTSVYACYLNDVGAQTP
ncbi:MAG TPA: SMP-30/gluconolactonase/LRE family protein [Steroidobacteraceae bacterium]|jgi:gluconolactonase